MSLQQQEDALICRVERLARGFYISPTLLPPFSLLSPTLFGVLSPSHDKIADGFEDQRDAMRFVCWMAGDPKPKNWQIKGAALDRCMIIIPRQLGAATVWIEPTRQACPLAPDFIAIIAAATAAQEQEMDRATAALPVAAAKPVKKRKAK